MNHPKAIEPPGREIFVEIWQRYSHICDNIQDCAVREQIRKEIIEPSIQRELQWMDYSQANAMQHREELGVLEKRNGDLEREMVQVKDQLLEAAALPLLRSMIEICEVLYFAPLKGSEIKEIDEDEKKELLEHIKNLNQKGECSDEIDVKKVGYHYKKWVVILKYSKHTSVVKLRHAILADYTKINKSIDAINKKDESTKEDCGTAAIKEFASNIAALYSYSSNYIHHFSCKEFQPDQILDKIAGMGFTDPSFTCSVRALMKVAFP